MIVYHADGVNIKCQLAVFIFGDALTWFEFAWDVHFNMCVYIAPRQLGCAGTPQN